MNRFLPRFHSRGIDSFVKIPFFDSFFPPMFHFHSFFFQAGFFLSNCISYSCVLQFPQLEVKTKTENETKLTKQITKVKKESGIEKALKFWNRFTIPVREKRNRFTIPLCSQKKESIHDSPPFFLESIRESIPKGIDSCPFLLVTLLILNKVPI